MKHNCLPVDYQETLRRQTSECVTYTCNTYICKMSFDKGCLSRMFKEFLQISKENTNSFFLKLGKILAHFTK